MACPAIPGGRCELVHDARLDADVVVLGVLTGERPVDRGGTAASGPEQRERDGHLERGRRRQPGPGGRLLARTPRKPVIGRPASVSARAVPAA